MQQRDQQGHSDRKLSPSPNLMHVRDLVDYVNWMIVLLYFLYRVQI